MPVNSDAGGKLLAWLAVGSGSLLAYSAVKNRMPWDVLRDLQGDPISTPAGLANSGPAGFSDTTLTDFSASIPDVRAVANRDHPPDLVDIGNGFKLDRNAASSYFRASKKAGYTGGIPITSAYRSFAQQSANYYGNNETLGDGRPRFGRPETSLHVAGLAIDVRSDLAGKDSIVNALSGEGWQRARVNVEPWHWSYLVRG